MRNLLQLGIYNPDGVAERGEIWVRNYQERVFENDWSDQNFIKIQEPVDNFLEPVKFHDPVILEQSDDFWLDLDRGDLEKPEYFNFEEELRPEIINLKSYN